MGAEDVDIKVAPARERGLKYVDMRAGGSVPGCRSREGAWIEMSPALTAPPVCTRRSREGAWIEISGRMFLILPFIVAPARERGLKSLLRLLSINSAKSLPRGSVD